MPPLSHRQSVRLGNSIYPSRPSELGWHVGTGGLVRRKPIRGWPPYCHSHFGEGVLTFQIPFLFKTPAGWNLMVRGPTNSSKDGIAALDGIIETDWAHSTFTMNWRFTRACTVEFALREPICLFFPIRRGVLEMFRGELRMLKADREFENKFREWSASRDRFLSGLEKGKPEVVAQGWQKDYMQTAKDKKPLAHPFANENVVDRARTGRS